MVDAHEDGSKGGKDWLIEAEKEGHGRWTKPGRVGIFAVFAGVTARWFDLRDGDVTQESVPYADSE
jgi:hypothetical protein